MPFTTEQFLRVFESYNHAVYPAQFALIILALISVYLTIRARPSSSRLIAVLLAAQWAWTGVVYHLAFFTRINRAAYIFGLLFIAQAALFIFAGLRRKLIFRARMDRIGIVGAGFIIYALLIYPALGLLSGHVYPRSPTFGVPCPTTIFTFGLLLWTERRVPLYLLLIPFLWSLMGLSAALVLGVSEDIGLFLAGVTGTSLILLRNTLPPSSNVHTVRAAIKVIVKPLI
ncbi:MAG TPA: DUF6064 family protein [Pyrinomonadaceae bacterium]|nr:DUF6064 family protein [Pyrinomonadaceae bacterium]